MPNGIFVELLTIKNYLFYYEQTMHLN